MLHQAVLPASALGCRGLDPPSRSLGGKLSLPLLPAVGKRQQIVRFDPVSLSLKVFTTIRPFGHNNPNGLTRWCDRPEIETLFFDTCYESVDISVPTATRSAQSLEASIGIAVVRFVARYLECVSHVWNPFRVLSTGKP
jgi:hypothetical protein